MATTPAAAIAKARREIQHAFFSEDAVRPDRAIALEPARFVQRRLFESWQRKGIIRTAGGDRYWLDVVAYDQELMRRHRVLKFALLSILVLLAVGILTGVVRLG